MIQLKEDAIFISDAHLNINRREFFFFLQNLQQKRIKTSQLFLVGDIFDLLIGGVRSLEKFYKQEINLLNQISKEIEIFYIEGNHDFNLQKLFPKIKVYSIQNQPLLLKFKDKNILLLHGDKYQSFSYRVIHKIFRHPFSIFILNKIDSMFEKKPFINYIQKARSKQICKKIKNFDKIIKQKLLLFDIESNKIDYVLEGHFHQGMGIEFKNIKYFNFASFACEKVFYQALLNGKFLASVPFDI